MRTTRFGRGMAFGLALALASVAVLPAAALADGPTNTAPVLSVPARVDVPEGGPMTAISLGSFTDDGTGPWTVWVTDTTQGGMLTLTYQTPSTIAIPWYPSQIYGASLQIAVSDGALVSYATTSVAVTNQPPTVGAVSLAGGVTAGAPLEGTSFAARATFTDPGIDTWSPGGMSQTERYTCTIDYGDGTGPIAGVTGLTGSWMCVGPLHTYAGLGSHAITIAVSDDHGGTGSSSTTVAPVNVAPVVGAVRFMSRTVGPNVYVTAYATLTDPGSTSGETYTCTVDYGDGSGPVAGSMQGTQGCVGAEHAYGAIENAFATIVITDSNGASGSNSGIVLGNSAPVVGPVSVGRPTEGKAVTASAGFADPGSAVETYTCTVNYGDGTGPKVGIIQGGTCFGPGHLYSRLGSYTVTVSVADSNGGAGIGTIGFTLANDAPELTSITMPDAFEVGVAVNASATFIDAGAVVTGETYTCTVDYGDGLGSQAGAVVGTTCTGPSHTYIQNGNYSVSVRITDSNGGVGKGGISVGVSNLGPAITGMTFNPGPSLDGGPVTLVATFTDPGMSAVPPETYTCVVDYGDGEYYNPDGTGVSTEGTIVGNKCYGPAHTYTRMQTFTATVFVFDNNGGSDATTVDITPLNVPPVVTPADGIYTYNSNGIEMAASVGFTDDGAAPDETYTCTIDYGDGAGSQAGVVDDGTCTGLNHEYAAKGTYRFVATVTDSQGAMGFYSVPIVIYNLWPTIGAVSAPASVELGNPVSATAPYDPTGMEDPDTCTVDYGDGTGPLTADAGGSICTGPSHTYSQPGVFQITVTVSSPTGAERVSASTWITVTSTLALSAVATTGSLTEGSALTATATFMPVGVQTYRCAVDYGDGTGALAGTVTGTSCKGPSHKYGRPGSFVATVTVTGSAGSLGSSTAALAIANVLPTITRLTVPSTAKMGTTVTVSAAFADPGTSETYQAIWTWSDGTSTTTLIGAGVRSIAASHLYSASGAELVQFELSDGTGSVYAQSILAVYDPSRTIVGSGTFASSAGSCVLTPKCGAASTAAFSVNAKYAKGSTRPTVDFTFSVNGLKFVATSADWLIVTGKNGSIQGTGTVNGACGYTFGLGIEDGHPDSLSILIVDRAGNRVYGTSTGPVPLKTGSITIK